MATLATDLTEKTKPLRGLAEDRQGGTKLPFS